MERIPAESLSYSDDDGRYYANGIPFTGLAFSVHPDKSLESESEYRNGLGWGTSKSWHRNGTLAYQASFFRDVVHGRVREWLDTGQIVSDGEYEYGITIWEKNWDKNGKLIKDYALQKTDRQYASLERRRRLYSTQESEAVASPPPG